MATVTATAYLDMRYGFDFSVLYYADYYQYASTIFRANSYDGFSAEFRGSGFTYSYYGEPTGTGTVTSYAEFYGGQRLGAVEGIHVSANSILGAARTYSTADDMAVVRTALAGTDVLKGGYMADYLNGFAGNDLMYGNNGDDTVLGDSGNDAIVGGAGNDFLHGGTGNDVVYGGVGSDTLVGSTGYDHFVFNSTVNGSTSVDRIIDFNVVQDTIRLENAVMPGLGSHLGSLASTAFWKSKTGLAHDSNDHIIYETDTGWLNYDSNGSAAGGSVHIATLAPNLALTFADFVVI